MKIGFLKHGSSVSASTRVRVDYVLPYIENAIASRSPDDLADCDVVIFQKRYNAIDAVFAQWLKSQDRKIIFDLTDPVWDRDYPASYFPITGDSREDFMRLLGHADLITFCTDRLMEMFCEKFPKYDRTLVIQDRIDLPLHDMVKKHTNKEQYIILWFGSKFSTWCLDLIRDDLEKLYKEIDFKLIIVNDPRMDKPKPFSFDTLYKAWSLDTINNEILGADITVNPHKKGSYKSNNKTVKSMALGVPCVEDKFYHNCKRLLTDMDYRIMKSLEGKELVKQEYDSRISAIEIEKLCKDI